VRVLVPPAQWRPMHLKSLSDSCATWCAGLCLHFWRWCKSVVTAPL